MKKSLFLLPLVSIALSSCFGGGDNVAIEYYPVQEDSDGKWGMIGSDGEYLFSDEYKSQPSVAINGVFSVHESDGITLYTAEKKPVAIAENLASVGVMNEGLIPVAFKGQHISFLNKSGKTETTLEAVNGKEIVTCAPMFTDGLLVAFNQDYKYGAVNSKGEVVVDFKYYNLNLFACGLSLATKEGSEGNKYVVLNTKGDEVFTLKEGYEPWASTFSNGYLPIRDKEGIMRLADTKGEYIKLPGKVKNVGDIAKKYFVFLSDDGKWGLMSLGQDNEVLVKAKYSYINILPDGNLLAVDDGEFYVLNPDGDKLVTFDDDYRYVISADGKAFKFFGREKNHYVLLDGEGKTINKLEFNEIVNYIPTEWVESDYFDASGFAHNILNEITDKGIGNYSIGQAASSLGLSAREYAGRRNFTLSDMEVNGYHYNIYFKGKTNTSIAGSHYDFWTRKSSYYMNNNAVITEFIISGYTNSNVWDVVRPIIYSGLKEKGFKEEKSDESSAVFTNDNIALKVDGGNPITITIANAANVVITPATELEPDVMDDLWE